jgi:CRP-like cAMP-binding protein
MNQPVLRLVNRPAENKLLSALPADSYERLSPHLVRVFLDRADNVSEAVQCSEYVHFPIGTLVVSIIGHTPSGASAEVGLIGNEGALGVMTVLGGSRAPMREIVDAPGPAYRVRPEVLRSLMDVDAALRGVLLQYVLTRMIEIAGTATCNAHHSVGQRLCRALLMRLQRIGMNPMSLTHERMATVLGARRAAITRAAVALRRAGVISYSRGRLIVLDRPALEACSCECFAGLTQKVEALKLTAAQ